MTSLHWLCVACVAFELFLGLLIMLACCQVAGRCSEGERERGEE